MSINAAKGIISFFFRYRCFRTMSRIYNHIIRQHKKFNPDTIDQCIKIPSRQVCSSYTVLKKHIPGYTYFTFFFIQGYMTSWSQMTLNHTLNVLWNLHRISLLSVNSGQNCAVPWKTLISLMLRALQVISKQPIKKCGVSI